MAKTQAADSCPYCRSKLESEVRKCKSCGEWVRWSLKNVLETAVRLIALATFVFGIWQLRQARELQEINAVNTVMSRYIELDRFLIEKPEYVSLTVPAEDYEGTLELSKTPDGLRRLQEEQFISYALDAFEMEFFLRNSYGVYPSGTEFVLDKFLTNPRVVDSWYREGLREWYSVEFRDYVERKMPRGPVK